MAYKSQSNAELYREMGKVRTYRNVDIAFIQENTTNNKLVRIHLSREDALAILRENPSAQVKCDEVYINNEKPVYKFYIEVSVDNLSKIAK